MNSRVLRRYLGFGATYFLLSLVVFVLCFPIYWMVRGSLTNVWDVNAYPPTWIPEPIAWENYAEVFRRAPLPVYFLNTMVIVVLAIIGAVLSSSLVAYGFAFLRFPGRSLIFLVMLATLMVPLSVRLIPLFVLYKELGWLKTALPLVVPISLGARHISSSFASSSGGYLLL
jgi:multiple sugar transport system permease protein